MFNTMPINTAKVRLERWVEGSSSSSLCNNTNRIAIQQIVTKTLSEQYQNIQDNVRTSSEHHHRIIEV